MIDTKDTEAECVMAPTDSSYFSDGKLSERHPGAVKVTISDPETGAVLEERVVSNDYCLICAGNRYLKNWQRMGQTHTLHVGVAK